MKSSLHCSREYALKHRPGPNTALISITTPGQENIQFEHLNEYAGLYRICFRDTEDYRAADGPTHEIVAKLYSCICACQVLFDHIVVHCEYGASRSAAVGLLAEKFGFTLISKLKATGANPLMVSRFNDLLMEDAYPGALQPSGNDDSLLLIQIPKMDSLW